METQEDKITVEELLQTIGEQTVQIRQLLKKIDELNKNQMIAGKTEGKDG